VQNQTIEHYLRVYAAYKQDDWVSKLALAEYTYNNSVHSQTGTTPFFAQYGYNPEIRVNVVDDVADGKAVLAHQRALLLQEERKQLNDHWAAATMAQKQFYDKKRKPMTFRIGDKVMLSTKNLRLTRPSKKLSEKYLGPFEVVRVTGSGLAYELKLPPSWRIFNTFHVSLLEPYVRREGDEYAPPPPDLIDDHEEWEVEAILDHKETGEGRKYLVR